MRRDFVACFVDNFIKPSVFCFLAFGFPTLPCAIGFPNFFFSVFDAAVFFPLVSLPGYVRSDYVWCIHVIVGVCVL